MGYKWDESIKGYRVWASGRHPKTGVPKKLERYTNGTGRIIQEQEAKEIERELFSRLIAGFEEDVCPRWSRVVSEFETFALERGLTAKTVENYLLCLRAHTFEAWKYRRVDSIEGTEIRELVQRQLASRSVSQQKNVLKFIRAVFSYALEAGYVQRNPTPEMKFRQGDKIKGFLTEPQVELLLNTAKDVGCDWYYHWALAIYTGMRNGELYALTWDRVDIDRRQILVNTSWNNKDGFKDTKSGDDRLLEIAPALLPVLAELKLQSFDSAFVLPRLEKWDKGEQARELRLFLMGLGLPKWVAKKI